MTRIEPPIPILILRWHRIVEYPQNHLNDFCIFRDGEGTWHAIGILGTGTWASEQSLFHASSPAVKSVFENHSSILNDNPPAGLSPQKHAPFVVERNGTYHLFYRRPPGTILLVRTKDPWRWEGFGEEIFTERDARDVCIIEHEEQYLMYYCQSAEVDGELCACVMARTSRDLLSWSEGRVVHYDRPARHSFLESPFVLKRPQGFYLFICNRRIGRRVTVVVFSEDPFHFSAGRESWLTILAPAHAAEIVQEGDDFYIAAASGPVGMGYPQDGGWVEIAPLGWTSA